MNQHKYPSSDFEVMPIGSTFEITTMRKLSNELIALKNAKDSDRVNDPAIRQKIDEIEQFYNWHIESYPA